MEFKDLTLHPDLQKGIADAGYVTCMPVQEQVLTNAFGGQDLYVQSQTGTGKTAAFLVVIFQRLLSEDFLAGKKALIMAPTRELAVQIEEEAKLLAKHLPFKVGSFYGGVGYGGQEKLLRENVQVLVGTPGRVLDLNSSGKMNLMDVAFLVLDEADRMFDMGFYPDLRKLIKVVPSADRRQTMLFSATLNARVKNLAWEYTHNPLEIEIEPEVVTVEEIDQVLYHVPSNDKMKLLLGILEREKPESAIVFCNTKRYTEIVAKRLRMNGYECEFIIGDLPQVKRLKVIEDLKAGRIRFLVATDVAARGLDVEALAMVVNYDLPNEAENYVHRIGRTARAGKTGRAITLASEQDVYELPPIERYIGKKIPSETTSPELYAEDKSAGRQVRTDLYDDRGDSSRTDSGRGERRSDGRRSENRGPDNRRTQRDRRDGLRPAAEREDRTRERTRADLDSGRGGRREGRGNGLAKPASAKSAMGKTGKEAVQAPNTQELSGMSFDERMALYKKKYGGAKPGAQADKAGGGSRPKGGRGRGDGAGTGGSGRQNQRPRRDSGNERGAGRKSHVADRRTEAKEQTPAQTKKGILSKLLGVFRKGK